MTAENSVRPSENDENGLSDMQAVYLCCLGRAAFSCDYVSLADKAIALWRFYALCWTVNIKQ
ncbi:MAG: hypothetical protein DU429_03370 [Candidatus Tokpelaia sp.]|nr:MAG: hypothetical protein DU430_01235 [Candidatus Tokpelaia sp.]KAA6207154.1 MAG: hypothetical protein DU429_03370 [Candidatus Tokpelaia sp.]